MCLAIYKPKGVTISKRWLKNGFRENDDGAGFSIARDGKIETRKGFFNFGEFWKAFKGVQDCAAVIHFRFATHGQINPANCHPFELCAGQYALVHNGVLNIQSTEEKSDTRHFAELVLEPMLARGVPAHCPAFKYLVEQSIGKGNKLALLHCDGSATLFNESCGVWRDGAWFSNESFLHKPMDKFFDSWDWRTQPRVKTPEKESFPDYDPGTDFTEYETERAYYRTRGFGDSEIDDILRNTL